MTGNKSFHGLQARRRWLAAGAAWPALAWTDALFAQADPRTAPVIIGLLEAASRERTAWAPKSFNEGMVALGWKLGAQYVLEERYAEARLERLPELAQEIAAIRPAVILVGGSSVAKAMAAAAPMTPIVLYNGDPLSAGLVTSLARPGGLITGVSNVTSETRQKTLELLVEVMPKLRRIGFLIDPGVPNVSAMRMQTRQAAEHFRIEPIFAEMTKPEDIAPAFEQLAKAKVQALVVLPSTWFNAHIKTMIEAALAQRWPVASVQASVPLFGGLLSFGHNAATGARRSAYYVDRILKGAKPGDLPIEQPTTFDFVLNLKTARQLGITIPPAMRVRATEVIE